MNYFLFYKSYFKGNYSVLLKSSFDLFLLILSGGIQRPIPASLFIPHLYSIIDLIRRSIYRDIPIMI